MRNTIAESSGRRIKQPWHRMNQFFGFDWSRIRRGVRCPLERSACEDVPVVEVFADENGLLHLVGEDDAHVWLTASIIGYKLNAVLKCSSACFSCTTREGRLWTTCDGCGCSPVGVGNAHNGRMCSSRQAAFSGQRSPDPVLAHDRGKWLEGTIDAHHVRLMHGRRSPCWPKVLEYALRLEQQHAASGATECPPPVQTSRYVHGGGWFAHDGGHRLYAALLSGLPLHCKWKRVKFKGMSGEDPA